MSSYYVYLCIRISSKMSFNLIHFHLCHAFIISAIVVTRRSVIFIEHFLWHSITVNHSRTNPHLCPTPGSQHVMSKWASFHMWAMTRLSYWFITACHGGREAGTNLFTCCDILGPSFSIFYKSVWRWASLTLVSLLLCYTTCMWAVPTCNRQNLGAIPSRLNVQKCLDDLLHSAGTASPLLSGWGLSYNHSQCTHRRLQELDIPQIEMGTAVVINNRFWTTLHQIKISHSPVVRLFLPADFYLCILNCSCL